MIFFSPQVWLNLIIFTVLSAVIFSLLNKYRINLTKHLINLFSLLTNQSAIDLTLLINLLKVRPLLTRSSLVLLTIVWLQSASVLTKAFTGLLLNTYFNVRSETLINSLEDLHQRTDIQIATSGPTIHSLSKLEVMTREMYDDFSYRIESYKNKTKINSELYYLTPKTFVQLTKGRIVIMLNSLTAENYRNLYKMYGNSFGVSNEKYWFSFAFLMIWKGHPLHLIVKFLFVRII